MSAMYSPHMADIIARVVLRLPQVGTERGGGASFSSTSPAARVGGSAASFSPGPNNPWFEGLKGPKLEGPLAAPLGESLEKACKEYLEYVTSTPYDKEAFKRGAELGSRVLKEAGGWEEANRGGEENLGLHEG